MYSSIMNISEIVQKQRVYFSSNETRNIGFRRNMLLALQKAINTHESDILSALHEDLGKGDFEAFTTEIFMVQNELRHALKKLRSWTKPRRVANSLFNFPSKSTIYPQPYGVTLIMSPWNYPFQLTMVPVIASIAAGNTIVLKPSEYASATSRIIATIIEEVFQSEYVRVILGGREANQGLLKERFDYIFFTGGVTVGKLVMENASQFLTPVTLELGGKSPCIVDKNASIPLAAKRIIWGKCINSGQTCVAPDYILVHESVKEYLIAELKKNITAFYGETPCENSEFPNIINQKHFDRLCALIASAPAHTVVHGGKSQALTRKIDPTVLTGVQWGDEIMQEEIFGPILPILTFKSIDEVVVQVNAHESPLALYLFTNDESVKKQILNEIPFGGGCINDTVMHLVSDTMPFGGVGNSGMGNYHGKFGFDTFTHYKSVLEKSTVIDIPVRYAPFKGKYAFFRKFL